MDHTCLTLYVTIYSINYTDCADYDNESECENVDSCLWSSASSQCYCSADVELDILFAIDSSDSIGEANFQIELDWLADFVSSGLSQNARVGINKF